LPGVINHSHPIARHLNTKQPTLTEAAKLTDDVGQADIGDTFQFTVDVGRDGLATHKPRLYIPRNQRHGGMLWVEGPNPDEEEEVSHLRQRHTT